MIGEDQRGVGLLDRAGEFPQGLGHQAGLQAHVAVAHLAFDLGARHERGHRVDHDDIHRARSNQLLGDFQRLFAGIGLRDVEVVDVHAAARGISRIERVFHVDVGGHAAALLRFGDDVLAQRRLAGRFRPINLGDAPARDAAHAQRQIERQRAGGDGFNLQVRGFAQPHDRAFAKSLGDIAQHGV